MQFIEFEYPYCEKMVLSWFSVNEKMGNTKVIEKSIMIDTTKAQTDLNDYADGKISLEDAKFKFNITATEVIEYFITKGILDRNKGTGEITVTEEGKKKINSLLADEEFVGLLSIAKLNILPVNFNFPKFSQELIEILQLQLES